MVKWSEAETHGRILCIQYMRISRDWFKKKKEKTKRKRYICLFLHHCTTTVEGQSRVTPLLPPENPCTLCERAFEEVCIFTKCVRVSPRKTESVLVLECAVCSSALILLIYGWTCTEVRLQSTFLIYFGLWWQPPRVNRCSGSDEGVH